MLFHSMPAWLDGTIAEPIFDYVSVKGRSIYWVDHSDNLTGFPEPGAQSNLYTAHRGGGAYPAVMGN